MATRARLSHAVPAAVDSLARSNAAPVIRPIRPTDRRVSLFARPSILSIRACDTGAVLAPSDVTLASRAWLVQSHVIASVLTRVHTSVR